MNKERRKAIERIESLLSEAKSKLEDANTELLEIAQAERDAFDSMPEGLQQSDKGQQAESAADALEDAQSELEDAIIALESVTDSLAETGQ